jgi:hypothetical protein
LISAGSLVRAQSGPPGTKKGALGAADQGFAIRKQTYYFEVWQEPGKLDPTP